MWDVLWSKWPITHHLFLQDSIKALLPIRWIHQRKFDTYVEYNDKYNHQKSPLLVGFHAEFILGNCSRCLDHCHPLLVLEPKSDGIQEVRNTFNNNTEPFIRPSTDTQHGNYHRLDYVIYHRDRFTHQVDMSSFFLNGITLTKWLSVMTVLSLICVSCSQLHLMLYLSIFPVVDNVAQPYLPRLAFRNQ